MFLRFITAFVLFFIAIAYAQDSRSSRVARQSYYHQYQYNYNRNPYPYGNGVGGPNGEGSTWDGTKAYGVSNHDVSLLRLLGRK